MTHEWWRVGSPLNALGPSTVSVQVVLFALSLWSMQVSYYIVNFYILGCQNCS